jgi:hypothetical protein
MRTRLAMLPALLLLAFAWRVPTATAAAEVHRFSIVLSSIPTELRAKSFNSLIDNINDNALIPRGLQGLETLKFTWMFDVETRYFVRQNLAVSAGVGRIRKSSSQEYLPGIGLSVKLSAHITSVPLHVGAAYYLAPYNQGDFQARAYVGAGFMSVVYNRASIQQEATGIPFVPTFVQTGTNDAPGYYIETGSHMFFASRYSILLSGIYRSTKVLNLIDEATGRPWLDPQGRPVNLDVGGLGFRMAVGIGF